MNNFKKNERIYNMHFRDGLSYVTISSITGTTCVAVRQRALKYKEHLELMQDDLYSNVFKAMIPLETDGQVAHMKHIYNKLKAGGINSMEEFMEGYPEKLPVRGLGKKSDNILFNMWFNYLE